MPLPLAKPKSGAKPAKKQLNGFSMADLFPSKQHKDDQQDVQLPPPKPQTKPEPAPQPAHKPPQPAPSQPQSAPNAPKPAEKRKQPVPVKLGQAAESSDEEEELQQPARPSSSKPPATNSQLSTKSHTLQNPVKKAKHSIPSENEPKSAPTDKADDADDFQLDDLFASVKGKQKENIKAEKTRRYLEQQENAKKNREAMKSGKEFDSKTGDNMDLNDDMGFTGQSGGNRKRTEEGFFVYTYDELRFEEGGDTSLCPFDCDCCFA